MFRRVVPPTDIVFQHFPQHFPYWWKSKQSVPSQQLFNTPGQPFFYVYLGVICTACVHVDKPLLGEVSSRKRNNNDILSHITCPTARNTLSCSNINQQQNTRWNGRPLAVIFPQFVFHMHLNYAVNKSVSFV